MRNILINAFDKLFSVRPGNRTSEILHYYKIPTITLAAGFIASIIAFMLMLNLNMRQLEREFYSDSQLHVNMFEDWLSLNATEIEQLSSFLAINDPSNGKTFHRVARSIVSRDVFEGIYWIEYENRKSGKLTVRDFVESKGVQSDIIANPVLQKTIADSFGSYQTILTEPLSFPNDPTKSTKVAIVFPIVRNGQAKEGIVALLDPRILFETVRNQVGGDKAEGYIFDITEGQEKMLYGRANDFIKNTTLYKDSPTSVVIKKTAAFSYSETIRVLSRQWEIVFVPTSKYISRVNTFVPWVVMLACLALSGMAGMFLFHLIGQKTRTEQIVRDRTIELVYTSNQLKARSHDLHKAKEDAEAANRAKGDFLANVSHEIRTPLNSLLGLTELLLETDLTSQQENYIRTVLKSSEDLMEIINDILDFSKIESGNLSLDPIPFDLQAAIEDTADLFAPRTRKMEQPLELLVHFVAGTPRHVIGDVIRVKQIISNLLNNAIKFTKEGYILVVAELLNEPAPVGHAKIKISVKDTGVGIPSDKLQVIFDKFSQADVSTTRKFGGTGLGLTICKQLAQLMQGDITVQSEKGEGSTFSATIVVKLDTEFHADQSTLDHKVLTNKRALILDDIKPSQDIIVEYLASVGVVSEKVNDIHSAFAIMEAAKKKKKPFDLLITDYFMSEKTSEIYTQNIKSLYPDLAIIMVTSLAEKGYSQIFASSGCDAYLTKPVRESQLLDILAKVFEAKQSHKAITMLTPFSIFPKNYSPRKSDDDNSFMQGAQILLVEDNRANRDLFGKLLENFGCHTTMVSNGEESIEILKSHKFDLIFMDCQMPEMDGFEASMILCDMKKKGEMTDTPIIALTANAMKGDRERCLESGMNDYITKPLRKVALRNILMEWLPPKEKRVERSEIDAI